MPLNRRNSHRSTARIGKPPDVDIHPKAMNHFSRLRPLNITEFGLIDVSKKAWSQVKMKPSDWQEVKAFRDKAGGIFKGGKKPVPKAPATIPSPPPQMPMPSPAPVAPKPAPNMQQVADETGKILKPHLAKVGIGTGLVAAGYLAGGYDRGRYDRKNRQFSRLRPATVEDLHQFAIDLAQDPSGGLPSMDDRSFPHLRVSDAEKPVKLADEGRAVISYRMRETSERNTAKGKRYGADIEVMDIEEVPEMDPAEMMEPGEEGEEMAALVKGVYEFSIGTPGKLEAASGKEKAKLSKKKLTGFGAKLVRKMKGKDALKSPSSYYTAEGMKPEAMGCV